MPAGAHTCHPFRVGEIDLPSALAQQMICLGGHGRRAMQLFIAVEIFLFCDVIQDGLSIILQIVEIARALRYVIAPLARDILNDVCLSV